MMTEQENNLEMARLRVGSYSLGEVVVFSVNNIISDYVIVLYSAKMNINKGIAKELFNILSWKHYAFCCDLLELNDESN